MLHSKALQLIQDRAVKAAGVDVKTIPGDDSQVIISQDGQREFYVLPPKPRTHTVESLDDFRGACEVFGVTSVWIAEDQVVGVIDREYRRDRVFWPLRYTDPFGEVKKLDGETVEFSQQQIVRWLKIDLWRCVDDETLVPALQHIKYKNNQGGTSKIGAGNASLGISIEQEVQGNERPLPETFSVTCRVHDNFGEEFQERIILSLQPDPARNVFIVQALPDEIPRAIERRLTNIQSRLDESIEPRTEKKADEEIKVHVPVFFGKP